MEEKSIAMPVGVVLRRTPGVTRWARWAWRAVAVLPGAGPAHWRELRREGEAVEFHAGTLELELHRTETEAYRVALSNEPPLVFVVMRPSESPDAPEELELMTVTASPYEAQDYGDTGEEIVEPVPAPPGLVAWINAFVERHHVDEEFIKRKRDKVRIDRQQDGIGDRRVRQTADVFRAPTGGRRRFH